MMDELIYNRFPPNTAYSDDPVTDTVTLKIPCVCCHKAYTVVVPRGGLIHWLTSGALIQHAMPELSPDNRELLISGICGTCFVKLWEDEEEGHE